MLDHREAGGSVGAAVEGVQVAAGFGVRRPHCGAQGVLDGVDLAGEWLDDGDGDDGGRFRHAWGPLRGRAFSGSRSSSATASNGVRSIINTASIAAMVAFPALSPYCASKGAVVMMTRTVAAEYAAAGIRANCICPGVTNTPLVAEMSVTSPEIIEGVKTMTPMGRVAEPIEMGKVAAFLAGEDSSFITGQAIAVDGGYTVL